MSLKIINCCPHTVSLFSGTVYDSSIGKSVGGKEILRFPKSGVVATAYSTVEVLPFMQMEEVSVPMCKRSFSRLTELPQGGDLYIVSSLYAQAAKEVGMDTSKLIVPFGAVQDEDGRTIGCTSFACA